MGRRTMCRLRRRRAIYIDAHPVFVDSDVFLDSWKVERPVEINEARRPIADRNITSPIAGMCHQRVGGASKVAFLKFWRRQLCCQNRERIQAILARLGSTQQLCCESRRSSNDSNGWDVVEGTGVHATPALAATSRTAQSGPTLAADDRAPPSPAVHDAGPVLSNSDSEVMYREMSAAVACEA